MMEDRPNMASDELFTIGKQPCQHFNPKKEWWGSNRHMCIYCGKDDVSVSFCETCLRDHHQNGYETCEYENKITAARILIGQIEIDQITNVLRQAYIFGVSTQAESAYCKRACELFKEMARDYQAANVEIDALWAKIIKMPAIISAEEKARLVGLHYVHHDDHSDSCNWCFLINLAKRLIEIEKKDVR
jgi:hypothetical protein